MSTKSLIQTLPKLWTSEDESEGWFGNISLDEKYITDGRAILLRSMVLPDNLDVISKLEDGRVQRFKVEAMDRTFNPAKTVKTRPAKFIGCVKYTQGFLAEEEDGDENDEVAHFLCAIIRDRVGRMLVVNAYLFSFVVQNLPPFTLAMESQADYKNRALIFKVDKEVAALMMPMRVDAHELGNYDWNAEPPKKRVFDAI